MNSQQEERVAFTPDYSRPVLGGKQRHVKTKGVFRDGPQELWGSPMSRHLAQLFLLSLPQYQRVLKYTQRPAAWIIFHPGGMPGPASGDGELGWEP